MNFFKDKFDKEKLEEKLIQLELDNTQLKKDKANLEIELQEALNIWEIHDLIKWYEYGKYEVIEKENKNIQDGLKKANEEISKYKALLEERDYEIKKYESLDINLKKILESIKSITKNNSINRVNKIIDETESEEQLKEKINDLEKENGNLKERAKSTNDRNITLERRNAELEGQLKVYKEFGVKGGESTKKNKELQDLIENLKKEIEQKNKDISMHSSLRQQLEQEKRTNEQRIKYLEDDNKKLREEAKDYLPFNAVYEIYNKLSDDVKSSLKTVFGDGVSKLSVLVNMTRNFSDFWSFLFDRINNDLLPESEIENLKHLFDISFEIMRSYDSKFERLETKEGDVFDPSIMNKHKLALRVDRVNKVLLLGYKRLNSVKSSLVI